MLRHPILLAFDQKEVDDQLRLRVQRARIPAIYVPFDDRGYALRVLPADIERHREACHRLLDELDRRLRNQSRAQDRLATWNELKARWLEPGTARHQVFLFAWSQRLRIESFTLPDFDLARAFILWVSRPMTPDAAAASANTRGDPVQGSLATVLRSACQPVPTLAGLQQMVVDLQREQDYDELFRHFAPRVLALAMVLFPAGQATYALAAVVNAIGGFLQFMQEIEDAEADGDITEAEVDQAWWTLLGILPFRVVQLGLMARALGLVAHTFLTLLMQGLAELPDLIERRLLALEGGWNDYGEYDPDSTVFIPSYALD